MSDFFISYNKADKPWAEWIARTVQEAKYTTVIQSQDFRPGENFILKMHRATIECQQTIAVLSPNFLAALFTQPEWAAAFAGDPTGEERKLIPVRVVSCEPPGLFKAIAYCDLVGLDEATARESLLEAVGDEAAKPSGASGFPGLKQADYPGSSSPLRSGGDGSVPPEVLAARELLDILDTTRVTFQAQCRVRNEVVERVRARLGITARHQYEDFFSNYFSQMNDEERKLHKTIRAYTKNVLSEYNVQALDLIKSSPGLAERVPSLPDLKRHLIIWLGKYREVFPETPSMCLVYVGVEEKVPFPTEIERELKDYLSKYESKNG